MMANKSMNQNITYMHFAPTYKYIVIVSVIVLGYVIAVTFLAIPKENQRYVDIAFGFLLNLLASNSSYLTGGTPMDKEGLTLKKDGMTDPVLSGSKTAVTTEQENEPTK